jgi:hypothetical protein
MSFADRLGGEIIEQPSYRATESVVIPRTSGYKEFGYGLAVNENGEYLMCVGSGYRFEPATEEFLAEWLLKDGRTELPQ